MPKLFHWRQKIVGSSSEDNFATNYIFKKSSSKCSSGCVGGSFHQHAELLFRIQFFWRKIQKQSWFLLEKKISSDYSYAHAEYNFDKLAKKRTRIQEYSAQILKIIIQTTSFLEKNFSWENATNLWQNCQNFSQISSNPPKVPLETLIAFWQNARKSFTELWKVFALKVTKCQVLGFTLKHFFPQKNPVHTRNVVFRTMQKFLPKVRKSLDQTQKPKTIILLKIYHLFRKLFWRHKLPFWQPSSKFVCQNPKNSTLKVRKHIRSKYLLIQF